jgi:hypothetical protein
MKMSPFSERSLALGLAIGAFGAVTAPAYARSSWNEGQSQSESPAEAAERAACAEPLLSQPFAWAGDENWYEPLPGESYDSFTGSGWTLSGGASVTTAGLADGTTSSILNLPSGSEALTPAVCVRTGYETARTMIRDASGSEGVQVYVSYEGRASSSVQFAGHIKGHQTSWVLSEPMDLNPSTEPGWQLVRFTLIANGHNGDFQLYNFDVDPRIVG